jgi:hypothetical protein
MVSLNIKIVNLTNSLQFMAQNFHWEMNGYTPIQETVMELSGPMY